MTAPGRMYTSRKDGDALVLVELPAKPETYQDTAEESLARLRIDLWAAMRRHGAEVTGEVYADAYRMFLDDLEQTEHAEVVAWGQVCCSPGPGECKFCQRDRASREGM